MNSNQKKYRIIENYSLLCADIPATIIAYMLAYAVRLSTNKVIDSRAMWLVLMVTILTSIVYYVVTGAGAHFFSRGVLKETGDVLKRTIIMFIFIGFMVYAFRLEKGFSRLMLGYFSAFNFVLTMLVRSLIKYLTLISFKQGKKGDQVLLVTTYKRLEEIKKNIEKDDNWSYKIGALAITDRDMQGQTIDGIPVMANVENIMDVLTSIVFDVVFIYYPEIDSAKLSSLVESIQLTGAMCHCAMELPAKNLFKVSTGRFADFPVVTYSSINYDYRMRAIKRLIDIFGSLIGLILTGLITPFVAIMIKLDSPGPVFFAQTRLSKNGRKFKIYKFRTMYKDAEARKKELEAQNEMKGLMFKMENDPRITKVGAFLRKTSIDELPQFWNVLRADMSLVGTRPPTVDEFEKYTEQQKRRLSIRPGLTGMWQVSGRSKITDFDEIVKLDLDYIDNWSLGLDFKILAKTILVVFAHRGAE